MNINYFLGANSRAGFRSLYGGFCRGRGERLHMIKAGPGGGKSGFMRRIAAAARSRGFDTECVLCSGDPDSLDAVYIPALKLGWLDATAPHICEPEYFGFSGDYVNLGRFCSPVDDEKIVYFTDKYRQMYTTAYSYLAAAGSLEDAVLGELKSAELLEKIKKRAKSAVARELGRERSPSAECKVSKRFIRCISCRGELSLGEDVQKLCKQIYLLDDRCGLAQAYLDGAAEAAKKRAAELIVCPNPLCPEKTDALLLPREGLGFVAASAAQIDEPTRHVRLDALVPREALAARRRELRHREKLISALKTEAVHWLEAAKANHDELERVYNPHVDFEALNAFADEEIAIIFG